MEKHSFQPGQLVRIVNTRQLAVLISPCKTPAHHWAVAIRARNANPIIVDLIAEINLAPYNRHCWNSACRTTLNSSQHNTCPVCFWVVCPECGVCKQKECVPFGLTIRTGDFKPILPTRPKSYIDYDAEDAHFDRHFWESIENMMDK
jgi:hypothetical protein